MSDLGPQELRVVASLRNEISGPAALARRELSGIRHEAERTNVATGTAGPAAAGRLTRAFEQIRGEGGRLHTTLTRISSGLGRELAGGIQKVALGLGALTAAAGIFGLKAVSNFEQTRIALDGMLGAAEAGGAMFQRLQELNRHTPFELPDLTTGARQLLGFQFAGEEVLPVLKSLTDAASGLGVGNEGLARMILNLGQVKAAGKVTGRELRDFATLGFPGYALVANILGVTSEQVRALGDDAEVSADQFINAVVGMQGPLGMFSGMAEAQSKSLAGLWSNVKDAFREGMVGAAAPLVDALKPMLAPGGIVPTFITTALTQLGPPLSRLGGQLLESIVQLLPAAMPIIQALADGLVRLLDAAGPGIAALAPLGGVIGDSLVQLVDALVPVMPDLVDLFAAFVMILPDFVRLLADLVPIVGPIARLAADMLEFEPVRKIMAGLLFALLGYRALGAVKGIIMGIAGAVQALAGAEAAEGAARSAGGAGGALGKGGLVAGGLLAGGAMMVDAGRRGGGGGDLELVGGTALVGATLGSVIPGVGTVLGGATGAAAGGLVVGARHLGLLGQRAKHGDRPSPLGAHMAIDAAVPGQRWITNIGLGATPDSDHVAGRAVALVGSGRFGYAHEVRRRGGYADYHGGHLHAVVGDTAGPRSPGGGDGSTPMISIAAGGALVHVENLNTAFELEEAVFRAIDRKARDEAERGRTPAGRR